MTDKRGVPMRRHHWLGNDQGLGFERVRCRSSAASISLGSSRALVFRSRSRNLPKRSFIRRKIRNRVVDRNPALAKKSFGLPIIESERLTDLALGKSPAPVPLDDRILNELATDRLRGISPLAGHRIRHIHHDFHAKSLA